ncbi:MAG: DUF6850 family outer membrane beta-barrel protein [Bacillota bacterium]
MKIIQNIKNAVCITLLSLAAYTNSNAQHLYSTDPLFKTIFESRKNVNPYYVGSNPAYLLYEKGDQLLSLKSSYNNDNGDFKRFIDPKTHRLYQVSASGKKQIDSLQTFKGSFGFQRLERKNWDWLVSKYYDDFNPFLFGDSTSGQTHYNGIVMNAQYVALVFNRLLFGFMLNYNVDEGVKEVSPGPTSEHRDIDLTLGGGYLFNENLSIGASLKIYDYNEKILYQQDDGAVSKEVLLLKFKGIDFPFINKKKTETRYSYKNGVFSYGNFSYISPAFSIAAYFGGGIEQLTIKEDANDPVTQGYWKNNVLEGAVQSSAALTEKLSLGVYYSYNDDKMWARHQNSSILMMENNSPRHSILSGLEYLLSENISLGIEGGIDKYKADYNDYYSHVFCSLKASNFKAAIGSRIRWSSLLSTEISLQLDKYKVSSSDLTDALQSKYYSNYRIKDILYYMTDYMKHSINSKIVLEPGRWGYINIYMLYNNVLPVNNSSFSDLYRSELSSVIEVKIRAY